MSKICLELEDFTSMLEAVEDDQTVDIEKFNEAFRDIKTRACQTPNSRGENRSETPNPFEDAEEVKVHVNERLQE